MSGSKLHLLGSPQLKWDGELLAVRRRKSLALLAYLAVIGRSHTRSTLATLFWPEQEPGRARANLRSSLSDLNKVLEESCLELDGENVKLGGPIQLDVDDFKASLHAWRSHIHTEKNCPDCIKTLEEGIAIYQDDFMKGFDLGDCPEFDDWQFFEREGLRNDLADELQWLVDALALEGEYEQAIPYARRWVALDTLHEPAHEQLMKLYAWSGQRAAALRQHSECERILMEELGVKPQEEIQVLHQAILENRDPDKPDTTPVGKEKISRPRHNLPAHLTPFVGREKELADLAALLDDPNMRLLSIIGAGGMGKTRLALEVVQGQVDHFRNGVFFISLEPLDSINAIVPTIADALGFSFYEGGEPKQQLLDYLNHKHILLLMDNFEHLLDGVDVVVDILRGAPQVRVLATSRASLGLGGEVRFHLEGMDFPSPISEDIQPIEEAQNFGSVQLFLQCAQRFRTDFRLEGEGLQQVIRICRLVGGMPLGIRLAAAWVEILNPAEIANEIEKNLDFLESDQRDFPERQRSMRAVFAHSWKLLNEREQDIFARLSVFRGGFTRNAAQAVTGATLRELMTLVHRSLLQRETDDRYTKHRLLRLFAAEKLTENPNMLITVRKKHSAYYCAKLQRWEGELKSAGQVQALNEMDLDIENCRTAWIWAVDQGNTDKLNQGVESLYLYYTWRYRIIEGEILFRFVNERLCEPTQPQQLCAKVDVLAHQAVFQAQLGQYELALKTLQKCQVLLDDPRLKDFDTQATKATFLLMMGDSGQNPEEKKPLFLRSLEVYRKLNKPWEIAQLLSRLGRLGWTSSNYDEGIRFLEESLMIFRRLGEPRGIAFTLERLGTFKVVTGEIEMGENMQREALTLFKKINDLGGYVTSLREMTFFTIQHAKGDYTDAISIAEDAISLCIEIGKNDVLAFLLMDVGTANIHLGKYELARIKLEESLELGQKIGSLIITGYNLLLLGTLAYFINEKIDKAIRLFQEGLQVCWHNDFRAIVFLWIGVVLLEIEGVSHAQQYFFDAFQIMLQSDSHFSLINILPDFTFGLLKQGQVELAVEIYAMSVEHFPRVANSRFYDEYLKSHIAAVVTNLPQELVAAAEERGRARDPWETARELLVELEEQINTK